MLNENDIDETLFNSRKNEKIEEAKYDNTDKNLCIDNITIITENPCIFDSNYNYFPNKIDNLHVHEKYNENQESIEDLFDSTLQKEQPIVIEQKSSIFNSKNMTNILMKKSELETFYEQNNLMSNANIYEDLPNNSDDLQNIILYDERIEGYNYKLAFPEKPAKRKKNLNQLRREIEIPLTHSIFDKIDKSDEHFTEKQEEENKFPYKSLNKDKEEKFEKLCDQ